MKAFVLPFNLVCSTCGFGMQSHGVFTGGGLVVSCSGNQCPEFEIRRRYQAQEVDLVDVASDDLVPIDEQPARPVEVVA